MPLSALCSVRASPGVAGGSFCSTTKVKCIPLPSLFNRHNLTPHTLKKVSMHVQRYTPAPPSVPPVVSYSMLHIPKPGQELAKQKQHHMEREIAVKKSRSLQQAREVIPHRLGWAFYMAGEPIQMFGKQDIAPDELQMLQQLTLSQNPALFYGSGIKSGSRQASRQVARFQRQLREAMEKTAGMYQYGGTERDQLAMEMAGRYSRLSRTMTPGSPILEETDVPPSSPLPPLQKTFLTDPHDHKKETRA